MLILEALLYGILSIFLLIVGFVVLDWVIPCDFYKEIFEEKNPAVGVLVAGLFSAMGVIIRSAVIGKETAVEQWGTIGGGILATLLYAGLGLALFVAGYLLLALLLRGYDLNRHIDEHNTAVGVALSGFFIAIALAVSGAIQ